MTRIRCVLAMLGTDVHIKGIELLGRRLRDAGIEVIYLGPHNAPTQVAAVAVAEDADAVGISFSTSTYLHHSRSLMTALHDSGWEGAVLVGGLVHHDDGAELHEMGVDGVFPPGSSMDEIVGFLRGLKPETRSANEVTS